MAGGERAIALLESIDAKLGQIAKALTQVAPKPTADARELDGQYGDPTVRFMPRDWTGPTYKGKRFSECPPEMLDMLASSLDYFAEKDEAEGATTSKGKPSAPFRRADAARARGWAARLRSGWTRAAASTASQAHQWADEADF